jgi:hypothetical protein
MAQPQILPARAESAVRVKTEVDPKSECAKRTPPVEEVPSDNSTDGPNTEEKEESEEGPKESRVSAKAPKLQGRKDCGLLREILLLGFRSQREWD